MLRKLMIAALAGAAMVVSNTAVAQGTAAEAKAMLDKAVAAVKADKAKAITSFNAGTDGFKDRDLYPFCFNISDGVTQAAPPISKGQGCQDLKGRYRQSIWRGPLQSCPRWQGQRGELHVPEAGVTEPSSR